jgi:hypothetical protein
MQRVNAHLMLHQRAQTQDNLKVALRRLIKQVKESADLKASHLSLQPRDIR